MKDGLSVAPQHSSGDIMIRNIQMKHAGKYTCAVQTKVDSSSIATDLIVRGNDHQYTNMFSNFFIFWFQKSSICLLMWS